MKNSRVLIAGAGIGGLAAALGLLRAGQQVKIIEQAAQLGEVGAGLSITPNAGKALIALGLGDALARIGSRPPAGVLRHYQTGATLVALPQEQSAERYGVPLYHVHRADLHQALLQAVLALDPNCLRLGEGVTAIEHDAALAAGGSAGIEVRLHSGAKIQGDWLVGADGIHSRVRAALFGEDQPRFTGYVAWRGLVPGALVEPSLLDPPMCMTLGPRRMLMRYPLRGGEFVNFVAIARRSAWMEEGWSVPSQIEELLEEFADFEPHSLRLLRLTPADKLFKWGLFDREPLPTWQRGLATLLGDAAHAMPPFTGQGAVMALEDAVVLARAAQSAADPAEAMHCYEQARHARVTAALAMSRSRADLYFADDPQQQVRALGAGMAELRTLYDYDAGSVTLTS